MLTASSSSSRVSAFSSDSFIPETDAEKIRLPDVIKITAEECIKNLKIAYGCALAVQYDREGVLFNTTDRLKKLELKHSLICNKYIVDFSEKLITRIERSPEYCHKLYNKYQKFLNTHTSLQCVHLYDILRNPTISKDFVMQFIPYHKILTRELHSKGLNILSLGNNRRVFSEY